MPLLNRALLLICLLSAFPAWAERIVTDIDAAFIIKPGETRLLEVKAQADYKNSSMSWTITAGTIEGKDCKTTPCIRYEMNGFSPQNTFNLWSEFFSADQVISMKLTNIADTDVTLKITRIKKTCTAEICDKISSDEPTDWLVFRIKEITSITTSEDKSYSHITGTTIKDKPFDALFVWWRYHSDEGFTNCHKYIPRWIENKKTPPYILSGSILPSHTKEQLITFVDTCTPNGGKFAAPEQNDFDNMSQTQETDNK